MAVQYFPILPTSNTSHLNKLLYLATTQDNNINEIRENISKAEFYQPYHSVLKIKSIHSGSLEFLLYLDKYCSPVSLTILGIFATGVSTSLPILAKTFPDFIVKIPGMLKTMEEVKELKLKNALLEQEVRDKGKEITIVNSMGKDTDLEILSSSIEVSIPTENKAVKENEQELIRDVFHPILDVLFSSYLKGQGIPESEFTELQENKKEP